jgi:hypothetical protein
MVIWAETEELLDWWGIRRPVSETFTEMAKRASARLGALLPQSPAAAGTAVAAPTGLRPWSELEALAGWASEADYAEGGLRPAAVDQARSAQRELTLTLRRAASTRLWLRWFSDPRLAWRGARRR